MNSWNENHNLTQLAELKKPASNGRGNESQYQPISLNSQSKEETNFEPLLDSAEPAALLKIHPRTLQRLARRGEIIAIQIGKLWRFRASALNDWVKSRMS